MSILSLQHRLFPLLRPFGAAYGAAMRLRARHYATGKHSYRAACPVISVGNIAWGGTGKTPVVDYLLGKAAEDGIRTAVLTRGYGASPPQTPFPVSRDASPDAAGDEPLMLARRHPEALILVDPDRGRAAAWAEQNAAPHLFILDDGMQHLAMARDMDIVLLRPIDILEQWGRVIPAGSWREGESALSRAHAFCVKADPATFSALVPAAKNRLEKFGRPVFSFTLAPTGLTRLAAQANSVPETAPDLGGERYTLLCGTGDPEHVRATARALLGRDAHTALILPDHHPYTEADVTQACAPGIPVVCTAKDARKLAPLLPTFGDIPVWVLEVRVSFGPALFTDNTFDTWWRRQLRRIA